VQDIIEFELEKILDNPEMEDESSGDVDYY